MDNNKKYSLSAVTEVESEAFMKDFNELCKSHSVVAQAIPQFKQMEGESSFKVVSVLFIQKFTEIVEPVEEGVVSPIQSDDLPTQA